LCPLTGVVLVMPTAYTFRTETALATMQTMLQYMMRVSSSFLLVYHTELD